MNIRKTGAYLLACALLVSCLHMPAWAAEPADSEVVDLSTAIYFDYNAALRTYEDIDVTVPAGKIAVASSSFQLDAGDMVTFHCSYSPRLASVAFGVIAPNGVFYHLDGVDGGIDKGLQVPQAGTYYVAIRNYSATSVAVTGHVNY